MKFNEEGKIVENEMIDTDRKFWAVPVTIVSNIWESGYHIYEADSAEEALEMYHNEKEFPHEIEYTGWMDQDYKYDELDCNDGDLSEIEELNNGGGDVQAILWAEQRRAEFQAQQEGKRR
tara:strand:+ start:790 stop:1149 length:360 start_codon:yes stop_codon:yes gene_type:complete